MSTILSTYSIITGQASSQARQALQDQRTSSSITGPTMFSPTSAGPAPVLAFPAAAFLAGATGVAGPENLVLDHGTDDVLADLGRLGAVRRLRRDALLDHFVLMLVEVVAEIEQELARRERLCRGRRPD